MRFTVCCVLIWTVVAGDCKAAPSQTIVGPETDLARAAASAPLGAKFILLRGRYYSGNIKPKDGQSFEGRPGAILSGAVRLGPFVRRDSYWIAAGPPPLPPSHGSCDRSRAVSADACLLREALFIDGAPLTRVLARDTLREGTWYQDRTTGDILLAVDPGDHLVELSYRSTAFYGPARNVTIRHLTIEQYASIAQHGAIEAISGTGWVVVDNNVRFNSGAGIRTGDLMRVQSNRVVANGQIGITGSGADLLVESNEIVGNNTHAFDPGWEAGATKFVLTNNLMFVRNCVHDNMGAGIWTDIANRNSSIIGNWAIRNTGVGISHEISGNAVIANNVSALNGSRGNSPWASQILVSGSIDTLVWHNKVQVGPNSGQGIFIVEEGRPNEEKLIHDHPQYDSRGDAIIGNEITYSGTAGVSGYFSSKGDAAALASVNLFEDNNVTVNEGELRRFRIGSETMSLSEARAHGQELRSRLVKGHSSDLQDASRLACPPGIGSRAIDRP